MNCGATLVPEIFDQSARFAVKSRVRSASAVTAVWKLSGTKL